MSNKNRLKRLTSLLLTLVMVLTMLPTNVFGAQDSSWGNMFSGGYKVIPSGGGGSGAGYINNLNSMNGYKISVWYAPMTGSDKDGEPIYDWDKSATQIGETVYFRRDFLQDTSGNYVEPAFYNVNNIYSQTTLGYSWEEGYTRSNMSGGKDFVYYATAGQDTDASLYGDIWSLNMRQVNAYKSLLGTDPSKDNGGQKGLRDWIARMANMENPSSVNVNTFDFDTKPTQSSSARKMLSASDFQLPFPSAMKDKKSNESGEYIKSYFLNPFVLNQISYVTRPSYATGGLWQVDDFLKGRIEYKNEAGNIVKHEQGQFKVFIEPVMFRPYKGVLGVMSWRDMMLEHKAKGSTWNNGSAISAIAIAVPQISNALKLSVPDETLKVNGKLLEVTPDIKRDTEVAGVAANETNGLGVGVITSPSLNSYAGPEILKTYVMIDSVDASGNVTYKKAAESVKETAVFELDSQGNTTKVPVFEKIEGAVSGEALLNDVVSTGKDFTLSEKSEWVNTALPTGIGVDLKTTAEDIAGYSTGLITGSKMFVEQAKLVSSINMSQSEAINILVDIYNKLSEQQGGAADEKTTLASFPIVTDNPTTFIIKVVDAKEYVYFSEILLGKLVNGRVEKIVDETAGKTDGIGIVSPANNLLLRYILIPTPSQYDVVELVDEATGKSTFINAGKQPLDITGNVANVQNPEIDTTLLGTPELVGWVTNSELPVKDISGGTLPSASSNGLSGTTETTISNYPQDPIVHNLYVKWRIVKPAPTPGGTKEYSVPEWRLSKYFSAYTDVPTTVATMSFSVERGCHSPYLSPSGSWKYTTRNPNGQLLQAGHLPANLKLLSWIHSETVHSGKTDNVTINKPNGVVPISGTINAIKSTDTSGLSVANWIDSGSVVGLKSYDVLDNIKGNIFNKKDYSLLTSLSFDTYNIDTYDNGYKVDVGNKRHRCSSYRHNYISPSQASYGAGVLPVRITFDRYNQQNTDSKKLTVSPEIKQDNGFTTIRFQQPTTLNIYPEYGMLFDNDAGTPSIKWIVGDQARKVSPVVYQTLEHKVYVKPVSTGTVATDSRAITAARSIGEATKQVLYKGGSVNTQFNVMKSATENQKGLLTVKTFALDFEDSVKAGWGNGGYSSQAAHDTLVSNINSKATATATEKLLVDSPNYNNIDYTGAIKTLTTEKYQIKSYSGNTVTTFTHELIVRGGVVIGVKLQDRSTNGYSLVSITDLKTRDVALYNAILGMNLYNESIDRSKTVFSTFEHATGDVLQEPDYATKLASARSSVDGLATPSYSGVSGSTGWYSEDSTVLVIKEYVTNYDVPSISFSDKLSMSVKGLESPVNKNDFFSKLGKGYTYLKYDLPIKSGAGDTSAYFEFTSFAGDTLDFGQQNVDYLVPNASVSDTTRLN